MPRISFRPDFISLLADDKASRANAERRESRRAVRPGLHRDIPPEGWRGGEADGRVRVARRWRLVGRQFGRIAAVSQLFSVLLFPQLFSTLHCAFRSAPADVLPVHQPLDHPPFASRPCPLDTRRASTIRRTFRYYRFSADERSGNDGRADHRKKHPSLSSPERTE